jgi:hypothetical protein
MLFKCDATHFVTELYNSHIHVTKSFSAVMNSMFIVLKRVIVFPILYWAGKCLIYNLGPTAQS